MTIIYLIDYDLNVNSGVVQKIKGQTSQWVKNGHIVYYLSTKTISLYNSDYKIMTQRKPLSINFGRLSTALRLLYSTYILKRLFDEVEFDLIYMRYRLYTPFGNHFLKKYTTIMEINSDDAKEYKLHSLLTHYYNNYTRSLMLKNVNAFVCVSDELKERFNLFKKPIEVIANGIDIKNYLMQERVRNKKPILVFIGTPNQSWHGVDKIEKMAHHFKNYQFYIIGMEKEESQNIKYFGYLSEKEATQIMRQCDVGIGTLSIYKTGLSEASPLKTRQYLAFGLPLIYAYNDTDIPNNTEFALKLENREDNIDYKKIEDFIDRVFNHKETSQNAREFAENVLGYEKKEKFRLEFFKEVLDGK